MMSAVPTATLVIANPTHYAIALRYVRSEGGAPKVVAKGKDLIALKIREIAEAHAIPAHRRCAGLPWCGGFFGVSGFVVILLLFFLVRVALLTILFICAAMFASFRSWVISVIALLRTVAATFIVHQVLIPRLTFIRGVVIGIGEDDPALLSASPAMEWFTHGSGSDLRFFRI